MIERLKFFWYFRHPHIFVMVDFATGVPKNSTVPLTAFKYKCRFCKKELLDITVSGWKQLDFPYASKDVFQWFDDRKE